MTSNPVWCSHYPSACLRVISTVIVTSARPGVNVVLAVYGPDITDAKRISGSSFRLYSVNSFLNLSA